jgi:diphthine synthase
MVETESDSILADAQNVDVVFLVVGDPYGYGLLRPRRARELTHCSATTHTDLTLRARALSIPTQCIPNASIMSAIGAAGLQLYNFGQTVSMVFFTDNWRPQSFYDRVAENRAIGLHTLVLLDIKVKEQSYEDMARGRKVYQPPRYMTVAQCAAQMLEVEAARRGGVCGEDALAVGAARVGGKSEKFVSGTLRELADKSVELLGGPLHSLVLLGKRTHEMESDFVKEWAIDRSKWDRIWARDYEGK